MTKLLDMTDTEILDFLEKRDTIIERAASGEWFVWWFKPEKDHVMRHTLRQAVCQAAAILKEKK